MFVLRNHYNIQQMPAVLCMTVFNPPSCEINSSTNEDVMSLGGYLCGPKQPALLIKAPYLN